jgi:hypothetical protein
MRTTTRYAGLLACVWLICVADFASSVFAQTNADEKPDASAFIRIPPDTHDWTQHFRIGALVGLNINAKFSMNGTFNISGNNPANGIYDDGYVRVDNTGNAGGQTAYWGYDNNSQYNLANQTLTMHANTSFSAANSANDDGGPFPGFDMAYGDDLWYWEHARVGWEVGFDLLPISITDNQPMSAAVNQSTYVFNTGWPAGVPIPSAPYQGLPNGGPGEPTISSAPPSVTSQTLQGGTITGTHSLDVMFYALRLGPSFSWDLSKQVGISLAVGPAVGVVSGDYKYDETITINGISVHNSGRFGATDMVFGGYVNATAMYRVEKHGDIYAGVQYMPMTDATFSSAGREGRLNLNGQIYFTVGVNWPF